MKYFNIVLLFCLLLANFSCKPPRSPIADDRVRLIHRIDGEKGSPTPNTATDPAFQTDATRIDEKPKGFKRFFGKIFKKKAKAGPDENDLRVDINPNAVSNTKVDSAKYNMDQIHYERVMRPSFGPEVTLVGKDPKQEYKGVPWWYPNKNPAVGYGYKPGYRYPGYKELSMDKRMRLMKKAARRSKTYQKAQDRKLSKADRKAKKQALKDSLATSQGKDNMNGEGAPVKKKGIFGIFKKKKKKEVNPMDDIATQDGNKKVSVNPKKADKKKNDNITPQPDVNPETGIDPPTKKEKKRKKKQKVVDPMSDIAQPKVEPPKVEQKDPTLKTKPDEQKQIEKPKKTKKKKKKKDDLAPVDSTNTN